MYHYVKHRNSHISNKKIGEGAMILALIDVVITLVFEYYGMKTGLKPWNPMVVGAAFLFAFGLFKYGQHITKHTNRMVQKIQEPRQTKYGTYDFRVVIGRNLSKMSQWYQLKKMSYIDKLDENTRTMYAKTKDTISGIKTEYELKYSDKYGIKN